MIAERIGLMESFPAVTFHTRDDVHDEFNKDETLLKALDFL